MFSIDFYEIDKPVSECRVYLHHVITFNLNAPCIIFIDRFIMSRRPLFFNRQDTCCFKCAVYDEKLRLNEREIVNTMNVKKRSNMH